jgi:hypothetical protein
VSPSEDERNVEQFTDIEVPTVENDDFVRGESALTDPFKDHQDDLLQLIPVKFCIPLLLGKDKVSLSREDLEAALKTSPQSELQCLPLKRALLFF